MLIAKRIQFTPRNVINNINGCFIIIYAPKWDDVHFANKVLSLIPDLNQLIFSGDMTCVMYPLFNRSVIREHVLLW